MQTEVVVIIIIILLLLFYCLVLGLGRFFSFGLKDSLDGRSALHIGQNEHRMNAHTD
jgi:hypothetical protein